MGMRHYDVDSLEIPTVGSSEHAVGKCKPCAFFHKGICETGFQCKFCHLCEPDEKKKRRKEIRVLRQEVRQQKVEQLKSLRDRRQQKAKAFVSHVPNDANLVLGLNDLDNLAPVISPPWPLPVGPVDSASRAQAERLVYFDSTYSVPTASPWLSQPLLARPPPAGCPSMFPSCGSVEGVFAAESSSVSELSGTTLGPEVGTEEMPTVGSLHHPLGACKPCAFLYKQGCENGVRCPFCHLCDPEEKKRRRKLKKTFFQMKRELRCPKITPQ